MSVGAFFIQCRNAFANISSNELISFAKEAIQSREQWLKIKPTWFSQSLGYHEGCFFSSFRSGALPIQNIWLNEQDDYNFRLFLDFVSFSILEKFSFTRKDGQYLRWDYRSPRFFGKEKENNL